MPFVEYFNQRSHRFSRLYEHPLRARLLGRGALFVRLEAKPGKEAEVEQFLQSGLGMVQEEPGTIAWFALKMGQVTVAGGLVAKACAYFVNP